MTRLCVTFTPPRIVYLSTAVICGIAAIAIIIYGIIKSTTVKKLQLLKPFLITYYILCALWIVGIIGYILFEGLPYSPVICSKQNSFTLINIIGVSMGFCGYLFGLIGVYFIFLLRLKYSFIDTVLQLSNMKFYILLSGIFIQAAFVISAAYYFITFQWDIGLILSYSSIVINAIYSISLVIFFSVNICILQKHIQSERRNKEMKQQTDNLLTTAITFGTESRSELISMTSTVQSMATVQQHHTHNDLAENTVKFAICASIAFLSSILINFMSFYRGFIAPVDTIDLLTIHVTLNVMDCLITVICLHLQFSYASRYYLNVCKCLRLPLKSYVLSKFDQQSQDVNLQLQTVPSMTTEEK